MEKEHKSQNIRHEESKITRGEREARVGQKAATLWMTGLSRLRKIHDCKGAGAPIV